MEYNLPKKKKNHYAVHQKQHNIINQLYFNKKSYQLFFIEYIRDTLQREQKEN